MNRATPGDRPVSNQSDPISSALIVEDNPDHTTLARIALERAGVDRIDISASVAEAFELIKKHAYGLVLIDYHLPDGYGTDLIDWITPRSRIVMMTGLGNEWIAVEAFRSNALDYVVKDALFRQTLPALIRRTVGGSTDGSRSPGESGMAAPGRSSAVHTPVELLPCPTVETPTDQSAGVQANCLEEIRSLTVRLASLRPGCEQHDGEDQFDELVKRFRVSQASDQSN